MAIQVNIPVSLTVLSLVSFSNAQIVYRRRGTSVGRIVAGCVVAGLAFIFFICLFFCFKKRRAARFKLAQIPGVAQQPSGQPLYNQSGIQQPAGVYQPPPSTGHTGSFGAQRPIQPYTPTYPAQPDQHPPPPYGKDVESGFKETSYQPPLGPPPAAHATGQGNAFVGGFRT